jgi:hypothetical protein
VKWRSGLLGYNSLAPTSLQHGAPTMPKILGRAFSAQAHSRCSDSSSSDEKCNPESITFLRRVVSQTPWRITAEFRICATVGSHILYATRLIKLTER